MEKGRGGRDGGEGRGRAGGIGQCDLPLPEAAAQKASNFLSPFPTK